jgi:hypothetical protein
MDIPVSLGSLVKERYKGKYYLVQMEHYDNMDYVILAYYNASSIKPIIKTCADVDAVADADGNIVEDDHDDVWNLGERSYIGGRLVVDNGSFTVFHIEPCEEWLNLGDYVFMLTLKDRIILVYYDTLYDLSKNDPDPIGSLETFNSTVFTLESQCKTFSDVNVTVNVTVNTQTLTITLPDGCIIEYTREGSLGEEFEGVKKIDADKIRHAVKHDLLTLEICQAIRAWLDSIL